jgi:hypothetical protein
MMISFFEIILYASYLAYDRAWLCPGYLYVVFVCALALLLVFAILLAVPTHSSRYDFWALPTSYCLYCCDRYPRSSPEQDASSLLPPSSLHSFSFYLSSI